jgi:hypothetical protein
MPVDPRQVPTLPVQVELALTSGRGVKVTLFLSITSALHDGPETLDEFLNAPRRLLPAGEGDKNELVARDAIVTARVASDIAPRGEGDAAPAVDLVRVELVSGQAIDGAVQHVQGTRLSDFFNAAPDFFAVEDECGVVFVNKRHVVSISM